MADIQRKLSEALSREAQLKEEVGRLKQQRKLLKREVLANRQGGDAVAAGLPLSPTPSTGAVSAPPFVLHTVVMHAQQVGGAQESPHQVRRQRLERSAPSSTTTPQKSPPTTPGRARSPLNLSPVRQPVLDSP